MKVKSLVLFLALMALAVTVSAQQDPLDTGEADSLILNWAHVPDFTETASPDPQATLELIAVNDAAIGGVSMGFDWIPTEMRLDSAVSSPASTAAFQQIIRYYRNNLDSCNRFDRFQFVGIRFMATEIAAGRSLLATYYFTMMPDIDTITVDTAGFAKLAFVTATGNIEYVPRYGGPAIEKVPQGVSIGDGSSMPTSYGLSQNYPNPFNPVTAIDFALPKASSVELTIFNVLGQKVITLINEKMAPGTYRETWYGNSESGAQVASGIYFYRLTADDFVTTKKMMMLK